MSIIKAWKPTQYVSLWRRFAAFCVDFVIITLICLPVSSVSLSAIFAINGAKVLPYFYSWMQPESIASFAQAAYEASDYIQVIGEHVTPFSGLLPFAVYLGSVVTVQTVYGTLMESSRFQATFGKIALGIQVGDAFASRMSFRKALLRNAVKAATVGTLGTLIVKSLLDMDESLPHDQIAQTISVHQASELQETLFSLVSVFIVISVLVTTLNVINVQMLIHLMQPSLGQVVLGVDNNGDGVWDDMEHSLSAIGSDSTLLYNAGLQYVLARQNALKILHNKSPIAESLQSLSDASKCLMYADYMVKGISQSVTAPQITARLISNYPRHILNSELISHTLSVEPYKADRLKPASATKESEVILFYLDGRQKRFKNQDHYHEFLLEGCRFNVEKSLDKDHRRVSVGRIDEPVSIKTNGFYIDPIIHFSPKSHCALFPRWVGAVIAGQYSSEEKEQSLALLVAQAHELDCLVETRVGESK